MYSKLRISALALGLFLSPVATSADRLNDITVTKIFVNKGNFVGFTYEPSFSSITNPNNCEESYLELDSSALLFSEQYALLLMAMASGKKLDVYVGDVCGSNNNLVLDWLEVKEEAGS